MCLHKHTAWLKVQPRDERVVKILVDKCTDKQYTRLRKKNDKSGYENRKIAKDQGKR